MHHERLLNEAAEAGAEWLLQRLPADQRPTFEPLIYQAVRQGVLHYAEGLTTLSRQLHPLDRARSR